MAKKKAKSKRKVEPVYCVWGLICSNSTLDQEKNNLSLINVIDQLQIPKEAFEKSTKTKTAVGVAVSHELAILFRRRLNPAIDNRLLTFDIEINLIDPNNKILQHVLTKLEFKPTIRLNRFRMGSNGILITTPGDYFYKVGFKLVEEEDFQPGCEVPFLVSQSPVN